MVIMAPKTFSFRITQVEYQEIQDWCRENIGEEGQDWGCRNFATISEAAGLVNHRHFDIRYETDIMAFKLRWL